MSALGINSIRFVFADLCKAADKMLKLRRDSIKHRNKLIDLSNKLNIESKLIAFNREVSCCNDLLTKQVETADAYFDKRKIAISTLKSIVDFRGKLLKKRQYLMAAELELYGLRRMTKIDTAQLLGLPLRTVENHINKINSYINNVGSIPANRICDALREAKLVTDALSASIIPEVPESVQIVIASAPSDLLFRLSDEELKDVLKKLLPYTVYDPAASASERILRDIGDRDYEPLIVKYQEFMEWVSRYYGYLDKAADYLSEYYKQYKDFIRSERRKSLDVKLYEAHINSPGKGYQQVAAECGVTVSRLRTIVSVYDTKFRQYRKAHLKS